MSEEKSLFETMGIDYEERNYNSIDITTFVNILLTQTSHINFSYAP